MDYLPTIKKLIKIVVRKFYELHHAILVDIILDSIIIYDSELQKIMKMHTKEINKLLVALKEDKIIKYENKVEITEDKRQHLHTVYYINYVETRDVIKYKIYKMGKKIEEDLKRSVTEGYYCKECEKVYSPLDAQVLMTNYIFKCDNCNGELIESTGEVSENNEVNSKFMSSIQDIIEILKELDAYEIPSMDFFQLIEFKKEFANKSISMEEKMPEIKEYKFEMESNGILLDDSKVEEVIHTREIGTNNNVEDIVYVNGEPKKYSEITDEDKEKMNEEEYEKYFEVYSKYEE